MHVVSEGPALPRALRAAGLPVRHVTPAKAAQDIGFAVGARLVILDAPPGARPLLEAHVFREAPALHAVVDELGAAVGPLVAADHTPCPLCLAQPPAQLHDDEAALRWVAHTVALEVRTLERHGRSALAGAQLRWRSAAEPGFELRRGRRRGGCRTPGCVG